MDATAPDPDRARDAAAPVRGRPLRFRRSGAGLAAALVAGVGAAPLATSARWLLPVLLVPLAVAAWAWRSGTRADAGGLTLTALIGRRKVAWEQVAAIGPDGAGGAAARLASGQLIRLPAVPAGDIPRLLAAIPPPAAADRLQ